MLKQLAFRLASFRIISNDCDFLSPNMMGQLFKLLLGYLKLSLTISRPFPQLICIYSIYFARVFCLHL